MTKISIITPTFNAEKFLENNIKSVQSQKIDNIEHILVDAISKDNTLKIVDKYQNHFSKVIIEKDKGIYDGMNKGIQAAQGELIGILNADDYYNEGALKLILKTFELSAAKDVVIYGDMYVEYEKNLVFSKGDLTNTAFEKGTFQINHPTVFVSKSLYERIGLFDIKYPTGADREFLLRAHHNKVKFIKIDQILSIFRLGGLTSKFSLRSIVIRTKEEFTIFKKYYSNFFALKKSIKQFYRMARNTLFLSIFGNKIFLKFRIKWIKKNG